MSLPFFLYRRLSRIVTCELQLPVGGKVRLSDKHQVASFQDVFCHPFYWSALGTLQSPPRLVIDCGAHCGHFTVLTDSYVRFRFGSATETQTEYIVIEPNAALIPAIKNNLEDAGIRGRATIIRGLVGKRAGSDLLWINGKHLLSIQYHEPA